MVYNILCNKIVIKTSAPSGGGETVVLMVKLVVLDMDGTVLKKGEKRISKENINAINNIYQKGFLVCFASGRSYYELLRLTESLSFSPVYAAFDGAFVRKDDCVLKKNPIDKNDILCIFSVLKNYDFAGAEFCGEYFSYIYGMPDFIDFMRGQRENQVKEISCVNEIEKSVYKITVFLKDGNAYVKKAVKNALKSSCRIAYDGALEMEIVRSCADKKSAADAVKKAFLKPGDAILAAGDSENDLNLLKSAACSIAMDTADLHIKNICNYTIKNISEIENILKNYQTV